MSKVFHLLPEAEPFSEIQGGAISRWAANVTRDDANAVICAPRVDGSWGFESHRLRSSAGLARYGKINDLAKSRIPWMVRKRLLLSAFDDLLAEVEPGDIVWIHNRVEYAAALSRRIHERGGKSILHMHNSHLAKWLNRGLGMPRADMYVFVSSFLRDEARNCGATMEGAEILYNGADHRIFFPRVKERPLAKPVTVVFAGRLVPEKGVHVFLEAMTGVFAAGLSLRGVVIGSCGFGDKTIDLYGKKLQAMAPPNVSFDGYCSGAQMGDRFRAADIFCLPSCWHDPFPLAVLEAMACRLPVVTTRSGGIPEALCEGGGVMVARGDVPELQAALMELAVDADKRDEIAQLGYESFQKNFTWQRVRDRYREILMKMHECTNSIAAASPKEGA